MTSPYDPILTGVGLLNGGKLTQEARQKYVDEVIGLLITGNADGKGGSPTTKLFNNLFPLPPVSGETVIGHKIFNVTTLKGEDLFWFDPDPLAAIMATSLKDQALTPIWNAVFPDLLYGSTAVALDANGSTPFFPLFDVSIAFPNITIFPIPLPDLAIQLNIQPLPRLMIKLADLGIKIQLPTLPIPPLPPSLPNFFQPPLFSLSLPSLDLPALIIGLIKLPFDLLLKLLLPPDIGLVLDLPNLPTLVLKLAFEILIDLILPFIQVVPKLLIASILIYVKNVVAMVCTDIVGMLVGSGGAMTKTVAGLTGLI